MKGESESLRRAFAGPRKTGCQCFSFAGSLVINYKNFHRICLPMESTSRVSC